MGHKFDRGWTSGREKNGSKMMNIQGNIETLSDFEIGFVGGANEEQGDTSVGDAPRDTCTLSDPWSCWPV